MISWITLLKKENQIAKKLIEWPEIIINKYLLNEYSATKKWFQMMSKWTFKQNKWRNLYLKTKKLKLDNKH